MKNLLLLLIGICQLSIVFAQSKQPKVTGSDMQKIEGVAPAVSKAAPLKLRKIVIFQKYQTWRSPAVDFVDSALVILGRKTNAYQVSLITDDTAVFTSAKLSEFDALVLNNTYDLRLSEAQSDALLDFVKGGKGVFALGTAIALRHQPELAEMIGGYAFNHPFQKCPVNTTGEWAIKVEDPAHPLTRQFNPEGIKETNLFYQLTGANSRQKLRVLLSLDAKDIQVRNIDRNDIFRYDNDFAVSWIREFGQGRIFYSHFTNSNANVLYKKEFLEQYLDGMQFVLGDLKLDATPIPVNFAPVENKKWKSKTVDGFIAQLRSPDRKLRFEAAYALGELLSKPASSIPALVQALKDSSSEVQYFAALSLGKFGKPAVADLAKQIKTTDAKVKSSVLKALGFIGTDAGQMFNEVKLLTSDKNPTVRLQAIKTIGKIAPVNAVPVLIEALKDTSSVVRMASLEAIADMGMVAKDALPEIMNIMQHKYPGTLPRREVTNAVVSLSLHPDASEAIVALTKMLTENWSAGTRIMLDYSKMGDNAKCAIPTLAELAKNEQPETRAFVALVLAELGTYVPEVNPMLKEMLNDKSRLVRHTVADAFYRQGRNAAGIYLELLKNSDWYVRLKACEGLGSLGPRGAPGLPGLKELMNDTDPEVRRTVRYVVPVIEKFK